MVEVTNHKIPQEGLIISILGPTASGKTSRAVDVAKHLNGEIISADSRQVYKNMDLGTGKDLEEYGEVPYHLIDICNAGEKYNLHNYIKEFNNSIKEIKSRKKNIIICGGSGMYLENALSGIILPEIPENTDLRKKLKGFTLCELAEILRGYRLLHNTTDIDTKKRAVRAIEIEEYYKTHPEEARAANRLETKPLDSLNIGIDIPRETRRERISKRLQDRLSAGMVEEVVSLIKMGIDPEDLIYYGLEYKYLTLFVTGKITYEQMVKDLETAIHQFAKRQMTWFRGMERRGFKIHWLPYNLSTEEFIQEVDALLWKNIYHQ